MGGEAGCFLEMQRRFPDILSLRLLSRTASQAALKDEAAPLPSRPPRFSLRLDPLGAFLNVEYNAASSADVRIVGPSLLREEQVDLSEELARQLATLREEGEPPPLSAVITGGLTIRTLLQITHLWSLVCLLGCASGCSPTLLLKPQRLHLRTPPPLPPPLASPTLYSSRLLYCGHIISWLRCVTR